MRMPRHSRTQDGFVLTLATITMGVYAFTGLVLDRPLATPGSRLVTVGFKVLAARSGRPPRRQRAAV
jgi:hypothetical protein